MTGRAYAIVRLDHSGPAADAHIADLEALASDHGVELVSGGVLLTQSDSSFCLLLAGLDFDTVDVVLVPTVAQISGWLGVLRHRAAVWTALPERLVWPSQSAESVPGPR
ncbi:hypothetical protein [Nocardia brasiliensis]|uniref:hypothetical protein n=1 Tax=Nocardia brasiliensis TaxID=37326 RepID=UPI00366B7AD0